MRGGGLDSVRLDATLAHRHGCRPGLAGVPQRPLQPAGEQPATLLTGARGAALRSTPGDRLGATPDRGRDGRAAPDGLASVAASGLLAAAQAATRGRESVRVALPGRSAAHRHQTLCALHPPGTRGHRRSHQQQHAEKREHVGYEYAHAIIDDHTRLAYSELHPDELAGTVVAFTQRALAWYAHHGIIAKRVMTDNAWTYTRSPRFNALLADNDVTHLTITPRRPQTNGKIERFHQTMAREWGYGMTYYGGG